MSWDKLFTCSEKQSWLTANFKFASRTLRCIDHQTSTPNIEVEGRRFQSDKLHKLRITSVHTEKNIKTVRFGDVKQNNANFVKVLFTVPGKLHRVSSNSFQ